MSRVWPEAKRVIVAAAIVSALVSAGGARAQSPEEQNDPAYMQQPNGDPNEPPPDAPFYERAPAPAYQGSDAPPEQNEPGFNEGGNEQPNYDDPAGQPQDQQENDQRGVM